MSLLVVVSFHGLQEPETFSQKSLVDWWPTHYSLLMKQELETFSQKSLVDFWPIHYSLLMKQELETFSQKSLVDLWPIHYSLLMKQELETFSQKSLVDLWPIHESSLMKLQRRRKEDGAAGAAHQKGHCESVKPRWVQCNCKRYTSTLVHTI